MKNRIPFFLPLVAGLICLFAGYGLGTDSTPLTQLFGFGLWLCLPVCVYYTWRGYYAVLAREAAEPEPVEEQSESEDVTV